jgi:hypothetical protein
VFCINKGKKTALAIRCDQLGDFCKVFIKPIGLFFEGKSRQKKSKKSCF